MTARHVPFLILGGGIAGLTCAIALKKYNIGSIVTEADSDIKPKGAGITLAPNALKAYRHLGLDSILLQTANSLKQLDILDHKGKPISRSVNKSVDASIIAIQRGTLHKLLLDRLEDEMVLKGYKALTITHEAGCYHIRFSNGETITADYVIAADGINSRAREYVLPHLKLRYAGHTCWRGIADNHNLIPKNIATESWGAAGRVGLVPINEGKIYWYVVKNAIAKSEVVRNYTKETLQQDFSHFHAPIKQVIAQTDQQDIIQRDIYDFKPIKQFAFGNLVLIGDAAHATTPNMGQGACQAIEDAVCLAHCIKRHSVMAKAFKEYEQRRMKRVHMIVNQSWTMGKIGQLENPVLIALRNQLFRSMPASLMQKQLQKIHDFQLS